MPGQSGKQLLITGIAATAAVVCGIIYILRSSSTSEDSGTSTEGLNTIAKDPNVCKAEDPPRDSKVSARRLPSAQEASRSIGKEKKEKAQQKTEKASVEEVERKASNAGRNCKDTGTCINGAATAVEQDSDDSQDNITSPSSPDVEYNSVSATSPRKKKKRKKKKRVDGGETGSPTELQDIREVMKSKALAQKAKSRPSGIDPVAIAKQEMKASSPRRKKH